MNAAGAARRSAHGGGARGPARQRDRRHDPRARRGDRRGPRRARRALHALRATSCGACGPEARAATAAAHGRPRRTVGRRRQGEAAGRAGGSGAPAGGSVADIKLGDQAHLVRASKIALSRFLAAKGNQEHVALRRALKREARGRKRGEIATRTWEKGVRAAQHLLGREVTGVMDGELQRLLERYWPSDSACGGSCEARRVAADQGPGLAELQPARVRLQGRDALRAGAGPRAGPLGEAGEGACARARQAAGARAQGRRRPQADAHVGLPDDRAQRPQPGAVPNSSHLRGFAADIHAAGRRLARRLTASTCAPRSRPASGSTRRPTATSSTATST